MRPFVATSLFCVFASGLLLSGHCPAESFDIARASLAPAGILKAATSVWHHAVWAEALDKEGVRIVPPEVIIPGQFLRADFVGESMSWAGYDTLILDFSCTGKGQLALGFSEFDGDNRENYSLLVGEVEPGNHRMTFHLATAPSGDLAATLVRDGVWNPDAERGVQVVFVDYPAGFEIHAMLLDNQPEQGAE